MFFFSEINNSNFKPRSIENAYLNILCDDLKQAQAIFASLDSPRANWGVTLTGILSGYLERFPSYFEVRNFLEIDLDFLIKNEKLDLVEQLLGAVDVLADINQETYKYVARVMYENKLYNVASEYLERSKKVFYKDPELHFMLAKYYKNAKNYEDSLYYINECLRILPDYYPAKIFKRDLAKYIAIN